MALEIQKYYKENENIWFIKPIGEVDIYTSPKFKEELLNIVKENESDILIDGKNLDYIDSTGLGVLISVLKEVREKEKTITLINTKPNISKLFDITGLNKVFTIE